MSSKIHRMALAVHDIQKAISYFEKLFDTKFEMTGEKVTEETGTLAAAAWDVGIELVQPIAGSDKATAKWVANFLNTRGQGILSTGFKVDSMQEALANADGLGIPALVGPLIFSQQQIDSELGGHFSKFEEYVLAPGAFILALNVLEEKPSSSYRELSMKINRVAIAVANIEESATKYEKLFGAKFILTGDKVVESTGTRAAADWEVGIELVQPIPGSAFGTAKWVTGFLESYGEGIIAAGFTARDINQSLAIAKNLGIPNLVEPLVFDQEQIDVELNGKFSKFVEHVLAPEGFIMVLNDLQLV